VAPPNFFVWGAVSVARYQHPQVGTWVCHPSVNGYCGACDIKVGFVQYPNIPRLWRGFSDKLLQTHKYVAGPSKSTVFLVRLR